MNLDNKILMHIIMQFKPNFKMLCYNQVKNYNNNNNLENNMKQKK